MTHEPYINDALFRRVLENANTALLIFDQDLCLTYLNPAGEMLFGLSLHRIHGLPLQTLFADCEKFIHQVEHACQSNHPFTERELAFVLPNQHQITADYTVTPLDRETADAALLVELAQVDRQLRIAREENLLAQHQVTREVIRGMAHEIKNPLGGIRGAAQLLAGELDSEELKEYTSIIIQEADRLQNLMNRMLGPNSLPQKSETNIHELLERVRQLVQTELPDSIVIDRDYDPSLPDIYADPDQMIQAVLNLTRNAAQALGDSGHIILRSRVLRQMTIGHKRYKLAACIEVIDDGPGIKPDILDKIFYPMVTGRAEGTGLGLPIAQALINQHDGLIECSSRPGKTVFTIMLPLETQS